MTAALRLDQRNLSASPEPLRTAEAALDGPIDCCYALSLSEKRHENVTCFSDVNFITLPCHLTTQAADQRVVQPVFPVP